MLLSNTGTLTLNKSWGALNITVPCALLTFIFSLTTSSQLSVANIVKLSQWQPLQQAQ